MAVSRKRSDKYKAVRKRVKRAGAKSYMTTVYVLKKSAKKKASKKRRK
jgi:hypothetical protein